MKDVHEPTTAFASSPCVCVLISDTERNKYEQRLKAWGQRKTNWCSSFLFNPSAVQLGSNEGAGRDAGLSPHIRHSTMVLNQTSCEAGCSEPLCLTQGSGPIRCPEWLLAELQCFSIKAARGTYETNWHHRQKLLGTYTPVCLQAKVTTGWNFCTQGWNKA